MLWKPGISSGVLGHLGQFLLGMCRWPLRTPTPLWSISWPIARTLNKSLSEEIKNQSNSLITFDTQLKTALKPFDCNFKMECNVTSKY